MEKPGRRSLGGREVCWGFEVNFWNASDFIFMEESIFITCVPGVGRAGPMFQLLAEMNEKRQIGESESVSYC